MMKPKLKMMLVAAGAATVTAMDLQIVPHGMTVIMK